MNYVRTPVTGGHVMQTIGASMQMLRPGVKTRAHRHTGSFIYQVAKGNGFSIIGGKRFEWQERDIFCVPSWAWHEHGNGSSSEDACLFAFNDLPVIEVSASIAKRPMATTRAIRFWPPLALALPG